MKAPKIELKLIRSFGIGIRVLSPTLNGFCVEVFFACLMLNIWSRGGRWFGFNSYWNG